MQEREKTSKVKVQIKREESKEEGGILKLEENSKGKGKILWIKNKNKSNKDTGQKSQNKILAVCLCYFCF